MSQTWECRAHRAPDLPGKPPLFRSATNTVFGNVDESTQPFRESAMAKQTPGPEKNTPPRRKKKPKGSKLHVTNDECKAIRAAAASTGRHGHRDATMIMMAFFHGFRAVEVVNLLWEQVNLQERSLHVVRAKKGSESLHPLSEEQMAALRILKSDRTGYVFVTERHGPLTTSTFGKIVARAGKKAGLPFRVHPHMLRHGCGYYFANKGQDTRAIQGYLGHKNIQHTVRYTALSKDRFKTFDTD
jgi:type 1 fimbriae regulatory protein FimE